MLCCISVAFEDVCTIEGRERSGITVVGVEVSLCNTDAERLSLSSLDPCVDRADIFWQMCSKDLEACIPNILMYSAMELELTWDSLGKDSDMYALTAQYIMSKFVRGGVGGPER
jgi:hypothetical protein